MKNRYSLLVAVISIIIMTAFAMAARIDDYNQCEDRLTAPRTSYTLKRNRGEESPNLTLYKMKLDENKTDWKSTGVGSQYRWAGKISGAGAETLYTQGAFLKPASDTLMIKKTAGAIGPAELIIVGLSDSSLGGTSQTTLYEPSQRCLFKVCINGEKEPWYYVYLGTYADVAGGHSCRRNDTTFSYMGNFISPLSSNYALSQDSMALAWSFNQHSRFGVHRLTMIDYTLGFINTREGEESYENYPYDQSFAISFANGQPYAVTTVFLDSNYNYYLGSIGGLTNGFGLY
jgi:hypothetical protein